MKQKNESDNSLLSSIDYSTKRKIVRYFALVVFFAIPFIKVNGQHLLLFDVMNFRIFLFFKEFNVAYLFSLVLFVFSLLFFFIFITQLFGRIWCGWFCPQTLLLDLKVKKGGFFYKSFINIAISFFFTLGLLLYFVSPYEFVSVVKAGSPLLVIFFIVIFVVTFIDIVLIGRKFCTTVCPYSMLQSIMFDQDTMRIAYLPKEQYRCLDCCHCANVCPVDIDIREGESNKCVTCASCIDACTLVMKSRDEKSIIGYMYGRSGFKPFRPSVIITFFVSLIFLIMSFVMYSSVDKVLIKTVSVSEISDDNLELVLTIKNKNSKSIMLSFSPQEGFIEIADNNIFDIAPKSKSDIIMILKNSSDKKELTLNVKIYNGKNQTDKKIVIRWQ